MNYWMERFGTRIYAYLVLLWYFLKALFKAVPLAFIYMVASECKFLSVLVLCIYPNTKYTLTEEILQEYEKKKYIFEKRNEIKKFNDKIELDK
jgi:hypothetical protein